MMKKEEVDARSYAIALVDRHSRFIGYLMEYVNKDSCPVCYVSENKDLCRTYAQRSRALAAISRYQNFTAIYKYDKDGEFEREYVPLEDSDYDVPFGHIHDVKGCRMKVAEI